MAYPGMVKVMHEMLTEHLEKEIDPYSRYTVGMLNDMLQRIDFAIDTRDVETTPQLMSATVKVCAGAMALLIMELSIKGAEDTCKKLAIEQISEQLDEALKMYQECLHKGEKPTFL